MQKLVRGKFLPKHYSPAVRKLSVSSFHLSAFVILHSSPLPLFNIFIFPLVSCVICSSSYNCPPTRPDPFCCPVNFLIFPPLTGLTPYTFAINLRKQKGCFTCPHLLMSPETQTSDCMCCTCLPRPYLSFSFLSSVSNIFCVPTSS